MSRYSENHTASQTGEWILGAARRNPEALLLLAAGCVLLMRSGGSSAAHGHSGRYREGDQWSRSVSNRFSRAAETATDYASEMKDRVSSTASSYAADIKDRVSETAGSYADKASELASDARRNISQRTERYARQAQSTLHSGMDRLMRDQPLAVALAGLAAGAAVAAVFPATEIEKRTLGSAREAIADAAKEAGEHLMGAAGKAGERLKSAAEERGLSSEGLKELAGEVAETFTSAAKGKSDDLGRATTVPENPSTGAGLAKSDANRISNMARTDEPGGRSNG
jgi:hypothetical protein